MEYVITTIIVGAFIAFILLWAKKTNEKQAKYMKALSQEQLDFIKNSGYTPCNNEKDLMETVAVLTYIKEINSSNAPIDFIYWNCCTQRYEIGESKISRDEINNRNLKSGDYINVVFKFKNGYIHSLKTVL